MTEPKAPEDIQAVIDKYANDNNTDILGYFGQITRNADDYIIDLCRNRKLRKNILLVLATLGGDPNAGYRIARCLQEAYKTVNHPREIAKTTKKGNFSVFVDGRCKSAGTLICLGADKLIMSGNAELGPIDIQLRKREEVGESESGLTPVQAIRSLEMQSRGMFTRYFASLRFSERLSFSTKMAADIAKGLTVGLMSPIYEQIDPIRLAEMDRSMRIAREYAERLGAENLRDGTLDKLLGDYPSHGFVIDRGEAKKLFKNVEHPDQELRHIGYLFRLIAKDHTEDEAPVVTFLSSELGSDLGNANLPNGTPAKTKKGKQDEEK
jgi:hypothetical protein